MKYPRKTLKYTPVDLSKIKINANLAACAVPSTQQRSSCGRFSSLNEFSFSFMTPVAKTDICIYLSHATVPKAFFGWFLVSLFRPG
jgi:hypothetical protein